MTSMPSISDPATSGVDTHGETHHAAVIDQLGREIDDAEFPTTSAGYRHLVRWMSLHGSVQRVGVEGTGVRRGTSSVPAHPGFARGRGRPPGP